MFCNCVYFFVVFFFMQKTAYELRISYWSSDVCSSDLMGVWRMGFRRRRPPTLEGDPERAPRHHHPRPILDWCRPCRRSRTSRVACQWIAPPPSWRGLRLAMTYAVKEIFKTLQGEGAQAGRAAVFCRFSGCNLWSGREAD